MNTATPSKRERHTSRKPGGAFAQGARQLAPAVLGRRLHSRHMAGMSGPISGEHWMQFLTNGRFWLIGSVVTILTLSGLWLVKDVPTLPRVNWAAIRAMSEWKPTFFIREKPAVIENGKVVEPGEKYYTVPSALKETR